MCPPTCLTPSHKRSQSHAGQGLGRWGHHSRNQLELVSEWDATSTPHSTLSLSRRGVGRSTLVGMVAGGAVAVGASTAMNDDGLVRSATFWSQAFPIFLHYKTTEYLVQGAFLPTQPQPQPPPSASRLPNPALWRAAPR
jgi:hypothetical protein